MSDQYKNLMSTAELARRVGRPLTTIYDAVRHGRVTPPVKIGRAYLWTEIDVSEVAKALARPEKGNRE